MTLGQEQEFLPPLSQAAAEDAAAAEGEERLDDLVPGSLRVRPRVQKRENPPRPVGAVRYGEKDRGR
jgi:hypothetical protein